jgi:tetratricopeptide (TPR) repeat protein
MIALALGLALAGLPEGQVEETLQLLEDWQLEEAVTRAQEILAKSPDDPDAWLVAGHVQHQRGEHQSALALLDAARDAGKETGYVHGLVASSAAYAAHFQSIETKHFSIRYLNKDEIVAHYAAPVLEAAYAKIGGALELLPAERGEKIVVEIYPDARGLAGATGLTVEEISTSGTIAVCKFHRLMITSPLATSDGYGWGDTVAHEFTHLVISKKSHNTIPIWLHEGIAKYYESLWKGAPGQGISSYSEKLLADGVRSGELITYKQMHPSMAKLPSQESAALAFAEVFTTIEFLRERYGAESIPKVLALTGGGMSLEKALRQVFGMDLSGIETAWKKWVKTRKFNIVPGAAPARIKLATEEDTSKAEKPLEEIGDRESHDASRLGELLQMRGHHAAAVVEYEKAYQRSGLRYPTLVYRLARAYAAVKRVGEALAVLDRSIAVHPEESDNHLLAGRLRLDQKEYDAAAGHFEAVRLQNPFNPEIHLALAALYRARGQEEAAALEERFLELSRHPRKVRNFDLPAPPVGEAHVSVVAPKWGPVKIDGGEPQATPLWGWALAAGAHTLEYAAADGGTKTKQVTLAAGDSLRVILD